MFTHWHTHFDDIAVLWFHSSVFMMLTFFKIMFFCSVFVSVKTSRYKTTRLEKKSYPGTKNQLIFV